MKNQTIFFVLINMQHIFQMQQHSATRSRPFSRYSSLCHYSDDAYTAALAATPVAPIKSLTAIVV